MKYRIAKYEMGSDDDPETVYSNMVTWAVIQPSLPLDHDVYAAMIGADVGHDVDPVDMDEHTFYNDPVFNHVHAVWIDTLSETVYMMENANV